MRGRNDDKKRYIIPMSQAQGGYQEVVIDGRVEKIATSRIKRESDDLDLVFN